MGPRLLIALLTPLLIATQCHAEHAPPEPPCVRACENLQRLGCEEGEPTSDGATCAEWLCNVESSVVVTLRPNCIASAESCDAARECSS